MTKIILITVLAIGAAAAAAKKGLFIKHPIPVDGHLKELVKEALEAKILAASRTELAGGTWYSVRAKIGETLSNMRFNVVVTGEPNEPPNSQTIVCDPVAPNIIPEPPIHTFF